VDLPTLLLVSLACLLVFRWFEKKDIKNAFIAGGTFGVLLLLRTQSMLILPVIILFAILAYISLHAPLSTLYPPPLTPHEISFFFHLSSFSVSFLQLLPGSHTTTSKQANSL